MYIAPTTTSTKPAYDIPVLVLASSDAEGTIHSRKFVARPSHYQELDITVRRIFGIKNDTTLVFGTSTLDACRGAWIEIEESAYEPLLQCLDEVVVRPGAPCEDIGRDPAVVTVKDEPREADRVVDSNLIDENVSNVVSQGRLAPQPDAPPSVVDASSTLAPLVPARNEVRTRSGPTATNQPFSPPSHPRSESISIPEPAPDVQTPKPTKSSVLIQLDELYRQKQQPLSNSRQRKPEPQPEPEREPEVQEKPKSKFRPVSAVRRDKIEPEPEPPKARRVPKRNYWLAEEDEESGEDDGEDDGAPPGAKIEEASDAGRKNGIEDEEDDAFWRFGTKDVGSNTTSSLTLQKSVLPPMNPSLNSKLTRKGTMIDVEVKKETEEKKGKIRAAHVRLSTVNATQLPRASARALGHFIQDPDIRFMVRVHGPRTDQGADFRTRGGHKIKKVLESVCKTFGLPFERSRLVLEDDSGNLKQYYCDPEDTIGSCGIHSESQLLVQVDGMTVQDLDIYDKEGEDLD